jgi:hypothetical protein
MYNLVLQCVRETWLRTTLSSSLLFCFFYYLLGSAWLVKRSVTPAIKAEWMSYKKTCMYMQEIVKERIYPSLFVCIHFTCCETRAHHKQNVGFGCACLFWLFLTDWYNKPAEFWIRRHGKTGVSLKNSAPCSMHHALRKRCSISIDMHWHFPLDVLGRVPIGLILFYYWEECVEKYEFVNTITCWNSCKG